LLLIPIFVVLLVLSIVLIPAGLALYAFSKDDESACRIRIYVAMFFVISALLHIFASDSEFVLSVMDLYMSYEIFFGIVLILNFTGLASAILGLIGLPDHYNKVLTQYSMIGLIIFSIFQHCDRLLCKLPRFHCNCKLEDSCFWRN
jgi:hypothetical protein